MDTFLHTAFALISSVGSAALTYVIMDARLRAAVSEEHSKASDMRTEQMRQMLGLEAGRERPGPQPYAEPLVEAVPLMEIYPDLQRMSLPGVRVPAVLLPRPAGTDAEPSRVSLAATIGREDVCDHIETSGRPRHRYAIRAIPDGGGPQGSIPDAGTVRSHLGRGKHRWRPLIR